jgi:outer membrane protein OmpA-like peptidoglycan-associated protein
VLVGLVVALAVPTAAVAQPSGGQVLDLELPVVDLTLAESSLDDSLQAEDLGREVRLTLAADVLFRFNKASLTPKARSRLAEVSRRIRAADPDSIRVEGYTDSKGSPAYNLRLSQRRAEAVAGALGKSLRGGPSLRTTGRGEQDPVAANTMDGEDNPRGRAKNRRVTLRFGR